METPKRKTRVDHDDNGEHETLGIENLTLNEPSHFFKRGLTKSEFTTALNEKLESLERAIARTNTGLQQDFYKTCKMRTECLVSYLIFELTESGKKISKAKKNNARLGAQSYHYLERCLEEDDRLCAETRDGFKKGKKPQDIHEEVMKTPKRGSTRLDHALTTWYHQEQAKLLELDLPPEDTNVDGMSPDEFVEMIDHKLTIKWWVQHCKGEIDSDKFKDLQGRIKLGFHVTIGRIVGDSLVSNDLMHNTDTDNWRNHMKVITAFAAYLAVLETCIIENQYNGLDYFLGPC